MNALRLVLLAIACVVLAGLGLRVLHPAWSPPRLVAARTVTPKPTPSHDDARQTVLSRLADAPDYIPYFDKLRAAFPSDYLDLVGQASNAVAQGARLPNPDRLITDAMHHLRQSRGILAAQAEAGPLASIFGAQAAIVDRLASRDDKLCADFLYGGTSPEFMAFAAKNRDVIERLALASLNAIISGKTSRVQRTEPTPDDFDRLTRDLKDGGYSEDEIAAVLDGKTFDPPLPESRLCAAAGAYFHAVERLPEDARLRVYALSAALLART